jgi:hypothetical protein
MMIQHPDEATLADLAFGHVHGEEREEYMRHVMACQMCSDIYAKHAEVWAALTLEESAQELPPDIKRNLMHRIQESQSVIRLDQQWSPELTQRLRVLLHAYPILELRRWDALREDVDTRHYDSVSLAMRVLDRIVESTGLGADVDQDTVMRSLELLLFALDRSINSTPDAQRHRTYLERLLGRLRNDADARRPFKLEYTDFAKGEAVRRVLELRLIEERFVSDERTVLRLSNEAVNLFLGALNLEIEDAQAAAEAVIQSQLERGRFDEAVQSAREAKFRSQQWQEKVEQILRSTRRDVFSVDWLEVVPRELREAVEHIDARLRVERLIAEMARERLEHLALGSPEARHVALIADLIEDCFDRHLRLHEVLITARSVFFREQERQAFLPRRVTHLPNLFTDALEPLMLAQRREALGVLEEAVPTLLGANAPGVFSLEALITGLLRPRRAETSSSVAVENKVWREADADLERFPPEIKAAANAYFQQLPATLSELLDRAGQSREPEAVLECLSLQALQAFETAPSLGLLVRRAERRLEAQGFWGDDLELESIVGISLDVTAELEEVS